jgi:hypothetical protein
MEDEMEDGWAYEWSGAFKVNSGDLDADGCHELRALRQSNKDIMMMMMIYPMIEANDKMKAIFQRELGIACSSDWCKRWQMLLKASLPFKGSVAR